MDRKVIIIYLLVFSEVVDAHECVVNAFNSNIPTDSLTKFLTDVIIIHKLEMQIFFSPFTYNYAG